MKAKQYTPKMHYCPDCNREFHWLGWPRHRAMHRDRKTNAGTTEEKNFREDQKKNLRQGLCAALTPISPLGALKDRS